MSIVGVMIASTFAKNKNTRAIVARVEKKVSGARG